MRILALHAGIHDAAVYGLTALLRAQFPNGAFPQGWKGPVEPHPVVKARFPGDDWKTQGKLKNYWDYYTLNDNLAGDVTETLIEAHRVYKDDKYRVALEKLVRKYGIDGSYTKEPVRPDEVGAFCRR